MSTLHFAVASTFSPRFRAVLAEADRAARMFGARLSVLHAGERTQEKAASFQEAFADLGRENVEIYWCEGGAPAQVLVTAAANEKFDLFIAGTIARPNDPRNFTGTIVRELFSRTPCDLLLIPDPKELGPCWSERLSSSGGSFAALAGCQGDAQDPQAIQDLDPRRRQPLCARSPIAPRS